MFSDRFHDFYHHHPHGAPITGVLLIVLIAVAVIALTRSGKA
jgi:hypothetical protein